MANIDKSIFLKQFQQEAMEHLQTLDQGFLELEESPENRQALDQVFRSAHTLKGTASMLGFTGIKELAHAMEDLLHKARDRELTLQREHIDLLLESLDRLKLQVEQVGMGKEPHLEQEHVERIRSLLSQKMPPEESPKQEAAQPKDEETKSLEKRAAPPIPIAGTDSVRIEVSRLDTLLNLTGELTISRSRLYEVLRELRRVRPKLDLVEELLHRTKDSRRGATFDERHLAELLDAYRALKLQVAEGIEKLFEAQGRVDQYAVRIQERVMQIRMLPISTIFATFPRIVRDAARLTGKRVQLKMFGSDTELDKRIIDQIVEPLMHLIRNGVDHGIEAPELRASQGKPPEGEITVRAYPRGNQVIVQVQDDGQGIDREKIRKLAVSRGFLSEEEALAMEQDEQIFSFLFLPGFSTKEEVSDLSGRGVGLDVVKAKVEELKGSIELTSEVGKGSLFTIHLPLTLSLTEVIMVRESGLSFAIPLANISEMVLSSQAGIRKVGDREAIPIREELVPLVKLSRLLQMPSQQVESAFFPVIIVGQGDKKLGIWVDELKGKQEIVIKSFGSFHPRVDNMAGATILGSGEIVPILDVLQLMQHARRAQGSFRLNQSESLVHRRVLVVEDSLVAREAEKSILEMAGYDVATAVDGEEAWELLSKEEIDCMVSDIEMPRLDGFSLLQRVRSSEKWQKLPVIVVTTRDSEEDKKRGLALGADRYVVKGSFDQDELLSAVKSVLP